MACELSRERLALYLEGRLDAAEARHVERHLEACASCEDTELVEPELVALLRDTLGTATASSALQARVRAAIRAADAAAQPAARVVGIREPWYHRVLASAWTPRLAMVATLAILMLAPAILMNRAPALAKTAVARHDCHAPSFGLALPACCQDLALSVGDPLGAPSEGAAVPDLAAVGLHLATSTRCTYDTAAVNQIGYRTADSESFSLYISDQVTEQFMQIRTREVAGVEQARHRLEENDVTIWEHDGRIYFWVGPHASPTYDAALAALLPAG